MQLRRNANGLKYHQISTARPLVPEEGKCVLAECPAAIYKRDEVSEQALRKHAPTFSIWLRGKPHNAFLVGHLFKTQP